MALDYSGIGDADVGRAAVKVAVPSEPKELPGRLAAAMHTVLCDGEWQSRSAAGIKWASDWIWPVKAAAAVEIYKEIAR